MVKAGLGTLREVSDHWTIEELFAAHDFLRRDAQAQRLAQEHAQRRAEQRRN